MTPARFQYILLVGLWFGVLGSSHADEPRDWRLDLLAEEKIPTDTASLKVLSQNYRVSEESLQRAVSQLNADQYAKRQQAQNELLLMGREALPLIRKYPDAGDPEVCLRLAEIVRVLETSDPSSKDRLLRLAVTGLLHERDHPGEVHESQKMFVELFSETTATLANGYRRMTFAAAKGKDGRVVNGMARLWGSKDKSEGDQRLLLDAKDITEAAEFPKKFQIDVKLGGHLGGAGLYHVGVSVGNVRALFHPGYPDGGFRFERVDDHTVLFPNKSMGFEPPAGQLLRMKLTVERLDKGQVKMDVVILSGKDQFKSSAILRASDIGKLDKIGLDRSGQAGGDAIFDDLIVNFSAE